METVIIAESSLLPIYWLIGGLYFLIGIVLGLVAFWPFPPRGGGVA